jgi:hypothetical protein
MAIYSAQITVTTSPTLLVAADYAAEEVHLHSSSGICFLGASDVTTSTGYKMDNGDKLTFQNHESAIYAITASGTNTMNVLVITK